MAQKPELTESRMPPRHTRIPYIKGLTLSFAFFSALNSLPGAATSSVFYNLTQYGSPLTERVSLPAQWFPSVGNIGYSGTLDLMWYATLPSNQETAVVSASHAKKLGAPSDFFLMTGPDNCWGMLMNFGLITLGQASDLIITLTADSTQASSLAPAFALYQGWDTGKSSTRHQTITFGVNNPLSTSGLIFTGDAYANNASNSVTRTFHGLAAGNYELFVTNRSNSSTSGAYAVNLQTLPSGTASNDPVSQSDLCGDANNQYASSIPTSNLCIYGRAFGGLGGAPLALPDGRYRWGCGTGGTTAPEEICYTLSTKNTKQNQAPVFLKPGSIKVPSNERVIEQASGGSGAGTLSFTQVGASVGIQCKLLKKGNTVTVSAGVNQVGSCLIRATKAASSKFNNVQSADYRITFER